MITKGSYTDYNGKCVSILTEVWTNVMLWGIVMPASISVKYFYLTDILHKPKQRSSKKKRGNVNKHNMSPLNLNGATGITISLNSRLSSCDLLSLRPGERPLGASGP